MCVCLNGVQQFLVHVVARVEPEAEDVPDHLGRQSLRAGEECGDGGEVSFSVLLEAASGHHRSEIGVLEYILILLWRLSGSGRERRAGLEQQGVAERHEEALTVEEARLSMLRRLGGSDYSILVAQGNLANTYENLGQRERALALRREVYTKRRVLQPEHRDTLLDTINLASSLIDDGHFAEARKLINETLPIARRVCGDAHDLTLGHRYMLPRSIVLNPDATQENPACG